MTGRHGGPGEPEGWSPGSGSSGSSGGRRVIRMSPNPGRPSGRPGAGAGTGRPSTRAVSGRPATGRHGAGAGRPVAGRSGAGRPAAERASERAPARAREVDTDGDAETERHHAAAWRLPPKGAATEVDGERDGADDAAITSTVEAREDGDAG